jgi:hypothetical protein
VSFRSGASQSCRRLHERCPPREAVGPRS